MTTSETLVWIDLETTGLDPGDGLPLEVGIRLTDKFGEETFNRASWTLLPETRGQSFIAESYLREMMIPQVQEMHTKNDLIEDCYEFGEAIRYVEPQMIAWLGQNGLTKGVHSPSGANVAFDRSWLKVHFPDLDAWFHYRPGVDTSVFRNTCKLLNPPVFAAMPKFGDNHRVQDCIDGAVAQYKHFVDNFFFVAAD